MHESHLHVLLENGGERMEVGAVSSLLPLLKGLT